MAHLYDFGDIIGLQVDLPEHGLVKGQKSVVLMTFSEPSTAYEVEFVADDGSTITEMAFRPDQIEPWKD